MAEKKAVKSTSKVKKADEVKTLGQLIAELAEKRTELLETKRSHASGELVNPRRITALRKEIARASTAIRALEIAELQPKESK